MTGLNHVVAVQWQGQPQWGPARGAGDSGEKHTGPGGIYDRPQWGPALGAGKDYDLIVLLGTADAAMGTGSGFR